MRELKFRVWDKQKKIMMVAFPNSTSWEYQHDPYITMQFTGLLDKNGKEIYEGDLLMWNSEILQVVWGQVGWDLCSELFRYPYQSHKDKPTCREFNTSGYIGKSKVIGNIYEHSNLLQKTNEDN